MVLIPDGYCQVTVNYSGPTASGVAASVFGFTIPDGHDLSTVCNSVRISFEQHMKSELHNSFALTTVRAVTETSVHEENFVDGQGDRSGDLAPPQVCALVKKSSAGRGRRFQGRTYFPGQLLDGEIDDSGNISGTRQTSLQNQVNDLMGDLEAEGINQAILHNSEPATPSAVTTYLVQPKVATQRRRLR